MKEEIRKAEKKAKEELDYKKSAPDADDIAICNSVSTYTVAFRPNGGEDDGNKKMNPLTLVVGKKEKLPECKYTYSKKRFAGWAAAPDGDILYKDAQAVLDLAEEGESITLYARWKNKKAIILPLLLLIALLAVGGLTGKLIYDYMNPKAPQQVYIASTAGEEEMTENDVDGGRFRVKMNPEVYVTDNIITDLNLENYNEQRKLKILVKVEDQTVFDSGLIEPGVVATGGPLLIDMNTLLTQYGSVDDKDVYGVVATGEVYSYTMDDVEITHMETPMYLIPVE